MAGVCEVLGAAGARLSTPLGAEAPTDWWQQYESSAMPVEVLLPQPGESVLDVCSGRGNKALQIGARLAGDGNLTCIEKDVRRTSILGGRLIRHHETLVAELYPGGATHARHRGTDACTREPRAVSPDVTSTAVVPSQRRSTGLECPGCRSKQAVSTRSRAVRMPCI